MRLRALRILAFVFIWMVGGGAANTAVQGATQVTISGDQWMIDGVPTHPGTAAEGLLMNVRMVNATFEDSNKPGFDPEANANRFIAAIPEYAEQGIDAFTAESARRNARL
ncbi:MAG: hypothetical protein R3C56_01830 [Pirellulaceae bacterium]